MKTRAEVLIDQISENQKLIFELEDKIKTIEQQIYIARENIKVARANLKEETR